MHAHVSSGSGCMKNNSLPNSTRTSTYVYFCGSALFMLLGCISLHAQSQYEKDIATYRSDYIKELLTEPRKPVSEEQSYGLQFFKAREEYAIVAKVLLLPNTDTVLFATSAGIKKTYTRYATVTFSIRDKDYTLTIYQSPILKLKDGMQNMIFLPFKDLTNGTSTYEGGRYLDLSISDIKENTILIDFNKCYNPYCAYSGGFACPVPPRENFLSVAIEAGEQKPAFDH